MKKRMITLLFLIITIGIYIIIFFYFRVQHFNVLGFDSEDFSIFELLKRPSIIAICTILGIYSNLLFDEIYKKENSKKKFSEIYPNVFSIKNTWLAIVICPVVIVAFNNAIQEITSDSIIALIAYQNGFFFKSITGVKNES